jgi:hypothetical protein
LLARGGRRRGAGWSGCWSVVLAGIRDARGASGRGGTSSFRRFRPSQTAAARGRAGDARPFGRTRPLHEAPPVRAATPRPPVHPLPPPKKNQKARVASTSGTSRCCPPASTKWGPPLARRAGRPSNCAARHFPPSLLLAGRREGGAQTKGCRRDTPPLPTPPCLENPENPPKQGPAPPTPPPLESTPPHPPKHRR